MKRGETGISAMIHTSGPVTAKVVHNDEGHPYAVIDLGGKSYTAATIFPDREALDSLVDQALAVRREIAAETRTGDRVRATYDDGPAPAYGTIIVRLDDEWAAVQWDNEQAPTIEALDELTGANR